jgi:hypothetical protein
MEDSVTVPEHHKKQLNLQSPVTLGVIGVVLVALSFYGGVAYQKGKTPVGSMTGSRQASSRFGGMGDYGGGGFSRGNRAFGTVSTVSDSSITVNTRSGSSATYAITGSTTVTDGGQASSVSSIQTGDTVILTLDSSNTKNVASIMLNPSFGGGPGGAAGTSGAADSNPSLPPSGMNSF